MDEVTERAKEGTEAIAAAIQIDPEKVRRHIDEVAAIQMAIPMNDTRMESRRRTSRSSCLLLLPDSNS